MPKYRIERRKNLKPWESIAAALVALLLSLLVGGILIQQTGANLVEAYAALFTGAFGSQHAIMETLVQATPLIFTGLAMIFSLRAKFFNLGMEGQFIIGAMAATWVSITFTQLPSVVLLTLAMLAGAIAGGAYAFIPGYLRAMLGSSEVIITVMLNFVMMFFLSYMLSGPWMPEGEFFYRTVMFPESAWLPQIPNSRLHLGFVIALVFAVVTYIVIWKMPLGYELRSVGENPTASRYKGVSISKMIILAMVISGMIAGLGGFAEVNGVQHRLRLDVTKGYGWTGIVVALMGQTHPVGVILAAVFFGGLLNGSTYMQMQTGVETALTEVLQGVTMVFLLAAMMIVQYRIRKVENAE
jgi:general nucleoside transport system permease protein